MARTISIFSSCISLKTVERVNTDFKTDFFFFIKDCFTKIVISWNLNQGRGSSVSVTAKQPSTLRRTMARLAREQTKMSLTVCFEENGKMNRWSEIRVLQARRQKKKVPSTKHSKEREKNLRQYFKPKYYKGVLKETAYWLFCVFPQHQNKICNKRILSLYETKQNKTTCAHWTMFGVPQVLSSPSMHLLISWVCSIAI